MNPCADCIRTSATCSWERAFIPVPGWVAEEKKFKYKDQLENRTFDIKFCPLFQKHPKFTKVRPSTPRPIIATNIVTGEQKFFSSIKNAVKKGDFLESCIHSCLKGKIRCHYGHSFRYADEKKGASENACACD